MALGPYLLLATLEGLVTAAVLALMALGLSLVFGVMRIVNVAHGEFFMLGAVLAWAFSTAVSGHPAIGFALALVLSPLVVGAIAFASGGSSSEARLQSRGTIVATIGLLYIIQQLAPVLDGRGRWCRSISASLPGSATRPTSWPSSAPHWSCWRERGSCSLGRRSPGHAGNPVRP